jgi:hypothetical protein
MRLVSYIKMSWMHFVGLMGILSCFISCAPKPINPSELSSDLLSLSSYAAEAELFIEYLEAGEATNEFAQGHITYLIKAVQETSKEIEAVPPSPGLAYRLAECREQRVFLSAQLTRLSQNLGDPRTLGQVKKSIQRIREAFDQARVGL